MKSAIKKTALLAALCILAISVLLHGVFWYISLDEINKNLKQSADSISQEIDSLNYSPNNSYENFAIVKNGILIYGEEKSSFYPSYSVNIFDGNELIVYTSHPIYAYIIVILVLLISLSIISAVIISITSAKKAQREINKQFTALVDSEKTDKVDDEELSHLADIIKKREENERIKDNNNSEKHRREFTANVSHELKTPLTTISGTAEILKSGLVKPEDIPHFAENIYSETQRMITLVNDIIKLSQLDENEIPLDNEPIDLYDLASDNIGWLKDEADKNDITILQQGNHVLIRGVHQILDEMVHNLCDNAIKYNKPGGQVIVSTYSKDGKAVLSIKDTGIGIPQKHQSHVFERFYRVDKSHSREIGGTGLGLSIVKHGASFHNAKVSLTSEEGVGTELILSFNMI